MSQSNGTGRCNSCGAPIRWVETPTGKRMPLDPEPVVGGNIEIGDDGIARVFGKAEADVRAANGDLLHKSHFATCPTASQHRQPKAR